MLGQKVVIIVRHEYNSNKIMMTSLSGTIQSHDPSMICKVPESNPSPVLKKPVQQKETIIKEKRRNKRICTSENQQCNAIKHGSYKNKNNNNNSNSKITMALSSGQSNQITAITSKPWPQCRRFLSSLLLHNHYTTQEKTNTVPHTI